MGSGIDESVVSEWQRAVSLGARGYVCAGEALLEQSRRRGLDDPAWRSMYLSTRASWLRQSGRHAAAGELDGAAAAACPPTAVLSDTVTSDAAALGALADAFTGLAADNLGTGGFSAARRLLDRVEGEVLPARAGQSAPFWWGDRLELRWRWVSAELALYTGRFDAAAAHAAAGMTLADACAPLRHRVKTELIAAGAAAATGDRRRAVELAAATARTCARHDLLPLQWAALSMLSGLGEHMLDERPDGRAVGVTEELTRVRRRLAVRGMQM